MCIRDRFLSEQQGGRRNGFRGDNGVASKIVQSFRMVEAAFFASTYDVVKHFTYNVIGLVSVVVGGGGGGGIWSSKKVPRAL